MITPAVLILASGSLILTTSQRLGRVIERVRKISQEFMQIAVTSPQEEAVEKKRMILYSLLKKSAMRCKLLTRAMTLLYIALGVFVATSLAIGVLVLTHVRYAWIPTALGLSGASLLFISSAVLIVESRLTYQTIADEIDFVIQIAKNIAPASEQKNKRNWSRWFKF
jgi:hypothetical protein